MGSKICMNTSCGAKTTVQWKPGWELKSGQRADLCFTCGSAYENLVYCDKFHLEETGWRECSMCNKRLHCGCTASVSFIQLQDFGGVCCTHCAASQSAMGNGISCEAQRSRTYATVVDVQNTLLSKLDSDDIRSKNVLSMRNIIDTNVPRYLPHSHTDSPNGSFGQIKPDVKHSLGVAVGFSNLSQALNGPPALYVKPNNDKTNAAFQDKHEPQIPSLNISLETSKFGLTFTNGVEEGEKSRSTSFQTGQRPRHILPKPPKSNISKVSDATKSPFPPNRVARPPAEGRLRNQLLPRYWPRITDQELQKLSGDLNSTIVPLFEKILSASDASRIGRLVLPKACAEAYFPPINQSEGLPLKIQDVKGKEWTFQFRFWPNNNSRMYVLEGVTNCIQSMQLQAGDTVTFSRIDPGGKLVIGYRKASNGVEMQDPQTSSPNPIGDTSGESFYSDVAEGLYIASGLTGLQTVSGEKDNCMTTVPEQSNQVNGNNTLSNTEKLKGKANEDALQQQKVTSDKKRMRNIGSKSKRLLMNSEDVMELRLTWEETQDLLRPPPCVKPNIVKVEEFEFEEYSEPPVFGKMTFFTTQPSGGQEQWAQCDKCCKWRKLPADVLLPPNWICPENVWDSSRSSCLAPEEISSNELDTVFRARKDMKKRRVAEKAEVGEGCEASGLDALARAATLGEQEEPSSGATTRHPRHRPGCTCIVCIQPPSGKGRHKPSCACNVCLTVKRRFKTLMMRKKKRQCERQAAELAQHKSHTHPPIIGCQIMNNDLTIAEKGKTLSQGECGSKGGHIDLNCHPIRDEEGSLGSQPNMGMPIAQVATLPTDVYMNPNGLANQNLREELHALVVTDQELDNEGAKEPTTD